MALLLRGRTGGEEVFEKVFDSGSEFLKGCTDLLEKTSIVLLITAAIGVVTSALLRAAIVVPTLESGLSALRLFAPIAEDEPTKEHTSEVGKVRYVAVGRKGGVGFDGCITDDEIFGFHRDGREEEHDALVGEGQTESQEYAIQAPLAPMVTHWSNRELIGMITPFTLAVS